MNRSLRVRSHWNQHRLLIKARRLRANAEIIICDRYSSDIKGALDKRNRERLKSDRDTVDYLETRH